MVCSLATSTSTGAMRSVTSAGPACFSESASLCPPQPDSSAVPASEPRKSRRVCSLIIEFIIGGACVPGWPGTRLRCSRGDDKVGGLGCTELLNSFKLRNGCVHWNRCQLFCGWVHTGSFSTQQTGRNLLMH